MEEKKFYQEIRDNLAAFSSTNYQFSVIPFKIDENTIVFPINKINMISGIGESYFSSLKKKELTFEIIDETTPLIFRTLWNINKTNSSIVNYKRRSKTY